MGTYVHSVTEKRSGILDSDDILANFSSEEKIYYHSLHPLRRDAHLIARKTIKTLLADNYGGTPLSYVVLNAADGSPYVANRPDIRCSISHSREHVAVMVGSGVSCGIDIEEKSIRNGAFSSYIVNQKEIVILSANFPPDWIDLIAWCSKEAALKCARESEAITAYTIIAAKFDAVTIKSAIGQFHIFIKIMDNYTYAYGYQQQ